MTPSPTPTQIAEFRKAFESTKTTFYTRMSKYRIGEYDVPYIQDQWQGYLRARTEQAAEIAELKAKLVEVMPLAKFGAMVSRDKSVGSIDKRELLQYAILADVITPNIEATIEQLLKD